MALKGNTTEEKIFYFLMELIGNIYGVCGLMANLLKESGLNPKNLENACEQKLEAAGKPYCTDETYTAAVDTGQISREEFLHPLPSKQYGYGLAQWTSVGRKAGLYDLVKSRGVSIGDLEAQLQYLKTELNGAYKSVLKVLKTAKSVKEASDVVLVKFEAPKDQSEDNKRRRAECGQAFYDKYAGAAPRNGGGSMAVRIGHASISENGTVGGAKGDQTGREVCVQPFYSKPWDFAAIHPDAAVREKHAAAVEAACANDNIGYSQAERNTLNALAKAAGYDLSKVGKCNCDCSSLQNVAAVASGSGAAYGSNGWRTSTMKAELQKLGYKIVTDAALLSGAAYCVRGAIYVKPASHTACALDNGAEYKRMLERAGIAVGTPPVAAGVVYGGLDYSAVFDATYYSNKYNDLKAEFGNNAAALFHHFIVCGMKEGRQAIATFNVQAYRARYPDLQKTFGEKLPLYYQHYIQFGRAEKRNAL